MQHQKVDLEQQHARQRLNVHVLFLGAKSNGHVLNRITAALARQVHKGQAGFCHVKIVIPDSEGEGRLGGYLSSSIYNGETVTLTKSKTFANPGWYLTYHGCNAAMLMKKTNQVHAVMLMMKTNQAAAWTRVHSRTQLCS
jgi:hypothetical protein